MERETRIEFLTNCKAGMFYSFHIVKGNKMSNMAPIPM